MVVEEEEIIYMDNEDDNLTSSLLSEYTGYNEDSNMESDVDYNEPDDSETDGEDDDNDILDEIYDYESNFDIDIERREECIAGNPKKMYILSSKYFANEQSLVLNRIINMDTFFKYSHRILSKFVFQFSCFYLKKNPVIEIGYLYLKSEENTYPVTCCILKTFWIRIIQRTWRRVMNERNQILKERKKINSLLYRELHGKFPNGCAFLPTIQGMLSYI